MREYGTYIEVQVSFPDCCARWLQAKMEGHEDATQEEGPWLFTLDAPSFQPVLTHVRNRSVSSLLCSP